jgi:hypothetical protein
MKSGRTSAHTIYKVGQTWTKVRICPGCVDSGNAILEIGQHEENPSTMCFTLIASTIAAVE